MQKYIRVFELTIKQYFAYRLSFILWRLRMFISLIIIFFLWNAVFDKNTHFATYDKASLLSYILLVNIISTLVLGTRTSDIASDINDGRIINYLLKPFSYFTYFVTEDVADKLLNLFFAFFEIALIIVIFKPPISVPHNIIAGLFFLVNGIAISFFINLMLSFLGFWTTEVWGPRFLYLMLVGFMSGSFFPLDLLPKVIYNIILFTPFPYLYYLPTKIFLGKVESTFTFQYLLSLFWLFGTWKLAKSMWIKGNKSFSFWGK